MFFVFVFVAGQLISMMITGGGFAVTRLSGPLSDTATTIAVVSTDGFLSASPTHRAYVAIGSEVVSYTGRTPTLLTGVTRGAADPQTGRRIVATAHPNATKVRTLNIAALDSFMGYNITTSGAAFGTLDAINFLRSTFVNLPRFLTWDYPWLEGNWVIVRFLLFPVSAGFIFALGVSFLWLALGIWR